MRQQHDDVDVKQGALSCRVFCLSHSLRLKSEILMSLQTLAQLGMAGHGFRQVRCQRCHGMTYHTSCLIARMMCLDVSTDVCLRMCLRMCLDVSEDEALDSQCMSGVSCFTPAKARHKQSEAKNCIMSLVMSHVMSRAYRHVKSGSASKSPCASSASAPRTIFCTEGTEGMIHTKASQGVRIASDSFSTKTMPQPQDPYSHRWAVGSHKHIGTIKNVQSCF